MKKKKKKKKRRPHQPIFFGKIVNKLNALTFEIKININIGNIKKTLKTNLKLIDKIVKRTLQFCLINNEDVYKLMT
jgi:hypothetical protein